MNEIAAQYESAVKYAANHDAIGQPIGFTFSLHHPDRGRMTFEPHTPRGVVADALEESGRDHEANRLRSSGRVYHDRNSILDGIQGEIVPERWPQFTDVGGYPLYYQMEDGGVHCSHCANSNYSLHGTDPQWTISHPQVNWEDADMTCDNCRQPIEAAYPTDEDVDSELS